MSGGASGAEAGTLSIRTQGDETIVKSFKLYFDAMGSNIFYFGGDPRNTQVAKLVNNMTLGITMNAVAEGLKLGELYKLPEQEILDLLKVSTGDSWVVRNWSDVERWTAPRPQPPSDPSSPTSRCCCSPPTPMAPPSLQPSTRLSSDSPSSKMRRMQRCSRPPGEHRVRERRARPPVAVRRPHRAGNGGPDPDRPGPLKQRDCR